MSQVVARRVRYFGLVQGVGFRRRAELATSGLAVQGYVRNLEDGSVELWAQGDDAQVDAFLLRIRERQRAFIEKEVPETVAPGDYADFRIRRD